MEWITTKKNSSTEETIFIILFHKKHFWNQENIEVKSLILVNTWTILSEFKYDFVFSKRS